MSRCIVETNGLTKKYGSQISVNHLNIHVPQGKIYGLLGRNGAGKTTTMKMLLNLVRPTSGSIFLFGEDYRNTPVSTYRRIGALIEAPAFYENLTAEENLRILARLRGQHRKDIISHALGVVGLDEESGKVFREYSLGMKQRLGIAAAIMHEPEILILDEPVNGLDPIGIQDVRSYLLRLCRENGTTILISSHLLSEVEQLADVIGIMHEGNLLEEAEIEELHKRNRSYVEFEVSDVNAAALLLERQYGISDYMVMDAHGLRLFEKYDKRAEINHCFVEKGIAVSKINVSEQKLEDYFSELIGGGGIG